jgi:plasmid stabilization system protein ParE
VSAPFQLTPQATEDLDAIWWFIAEDNRDAADRVEMEIIATCRRLAKHPLMGTRRQDITPLAVRFWTVTKFPNYVIVYRPDTVPLQVVAVLHSKRDLKEALEKRPL